MAVMARIGRLFKGFFGLFISGLEERNPDALMEAARQEFRDKMAQYNLALAQMAGVAERLKNQIKAKTGRAQELERRILANHQAGNLELAAALSSVAFKVGDLGDSMKTVEEVLTKRYERSAGKARVAADLVDMDKIQEKENERKALEQTALAEFLASQGIQSAAAPEASATAKEIGPVRQGS